MALPPGLTAGYAAKLRRVLRLLDKDDVVAASDLLDELIRDDDQFRAFGRSKAHTLFSKSLKATGVYWQACIENYEAKLVVLDSIKADLRSARSRSGNKKRTR